MQTGEIGELAICGLDENQNSPLNDPIGAANWGPDRRIRGELIVWLCTDRKASDAVSHRGIKVFGAKITGTVDLTSANIQFPLGFAYCKFTDEINLQTASFRILSFPGTHFKSILADGALVTGAVLVRGSRFSELRLTGARIEGQFDSSECVFDQLILDACVVKAGVFLRQAQGQVKMTRARIGADLDCQGASLSSSAVPSEAALDAGGINVEGSVFLRYGFSSKGLVLLHGAKIGLNLDCVGGRFGILGQNATADNTALNFDSSSIGGTAVLSTGFHGEGVVRLVSSQIEGDLRCDGATFERGLVAERAVVRGALFWRDIGNSDSVMLDLLHTSVDSLSDDVKSWPPCGNLQLHGFVYSLIAWSSERHADARLDWLSRLKQFTPQPYRQLARVLNEEGDEDGARKVLYELASLRAREDASWATRIWNFLLKVVIGYGYYPSWAIAWLAGLILIGFLFFSFAFRAGIMVPTEKTAYTSFENDRRVPSYYEGFYAFVYSAENSLPIVKLGQADRWQVEPNLEAQVPESSHKLDFWTPPPLITNSLRVFQWCQIALGWFFTTMGIAGIAGLVRKLES